MVETRVMSVIRPVLREAGILTPGATSYAPPGDYQGLQRRPTKPYVSGSPSWGAQSFGDYRAVVARAKCNVGHVTGIRLMSLSSSTRVPTIDLRVSDPEVITEIFTRFSSIIMLYDASMARYGGRLDTIGFDVLREWPDYINEELALLLNQSNLSLPEGCRERQGNPFSESNFYMFFRRAPSTEEGEVSNAVLKANMIEHHELVRHYLDGAGACEPEKMKKRVLREMLNVEKELGLSPKPGR